MSPDEPHDDGGAETRWRCRCLLGQAAAPQVIVSILSQLPGAWSPANQRWFVQECINHRLNVAFPRSPTYERAVLRAAVLAAEAGAGEVDESLMEAFTRHLRAPVEPPPAEVGGHHSQHTALALQAGWRYKLYAYAPASAAAADVQRRTAALEREIAAAGDGVAVGDGQYGIMAVHLTNSMFEGGTGCAEWQAGHFLAEFVLSSAHLFAGRSILELGCGTGMAGVALHRAGAARVVCTDGNPQTVANCAANLRLNGVPLAGDGGAGGGGGARVQRLVWEEGWGPDQGAPPDVVVGADLIYDPEVIPALLRLLTQILEAPRGGGGGASAPPPCIYLSTMLRNEASAARFVDAVGADPRLELEDATAEAAAAVAAGVRLCHLAPVEAPWERLMVHRLRLSLPP
jgi:hypothetical protein